MEKKNVISTISAADQEILRLNNRVIDESPDLIAVIGTDCRYTYVNPAYVNAHEMTADDFIGIHIRDILGEEVFDNIIVPKIQKCLDGETVRYETKFDFTENGVRFMEVRYMPLVDNDNRVESIVIITRDISERKRAEIELRKSTEFLYNIINSLDDPVFVKDQNSRYLIINSKLCAMFGKRTEEIVGLTDYDLYEASEADVFRKTDEYVLTTGEPNINEEEATWLGLTYTVLTKKSLYTDSVSGRKFVVGVIRDITDRKIAEEKLAYMATHDPLTGLPNRSLFAEILTRSLLLAHRNRCQLAVMLLDLDKFKEVNDTLGHKTGDILLEAVSTRLRKALRKSDTVARMSGDEFLVLLPNIHNSTEATCIAMKLLDAMNEPFTCGDHLLSMSYSIGVALYPCHGNDTDTLVRHADIAMYTAKRSDRNAYRLFSDDMDMTSHTI